jgi:Ca2+-binding RTX toxin-like protein
VIDLVIATPVAAGATGADLIGGAGVTEPDGEAIISATVTLGAGRDATDRIVASGYALTADGADLVIGDTGIRVVGGGLDPATGVLSLAGAASAATYAAVLDSLTLVNQAGGALAIGTRSVTVTITDAAGDSATDATSLIVSSSVITGNGTDRTMQGTPGADVFIGSSGNETMRGTAGNDLFLIETGGGDDTVQGGGGFDVLMLKGVTGGPVATPSVAGDWTLVLDAADPGLVQDDASIVFSGAASGRIVFGDGSQVDFSTIERITW